MTSRAMSYAETRRTVNSLFQKDCFRVEIPQATLVGMMCLKDVRVARKELARLTSIAVELGVDADLIERTLDRSIKPTPYYDKCGGRKNKREREGICKVLLWLHSEIISREKTKCIEP